MKSRKQLEAQQRYKKEQEEKQRIKNEELRLEMERRKKEQMEKEAHEARIQEERQIREVQLAQLHCQRLARLLATCRDTLASWAIEHWQNKQFHWCMRCDGLPDPTHLPQLNAYRYRWIDYSNTTEPSVERLLSRAPELFQVLHDLNELLENTHEIAPKKVQQLCQIRMELSQLLSQEIDSTVKSVLSDVERHILADESQLNVQTCSKSFSLGLGTDTAKNSSLTLHDFQRLGVRVDLPQIILGHVKPVVVSFIWFKEGHYLEPTQLNGVPKMPSLLKPVRKGDPIYEHVPESMRIENDGLENSLVVEESSGGASSDQLDFEKFFLVMGIMQIQLLQLPIQPRRFTDWTVVPLEDGDTIRFYEFHANFSGSTATKESADKSGKKNKNDDDEEPNDAKEMNEELKKLITVRIKLPPSAFWLGCPKPVIYHEESGTWKTRGVWDVRFIEEIGGPSIQFRVEKPSVFALSQAKRLNIPLQGWTLVPSHMRSSIINALVSKAPTEIAKSSTENRGGGGGGGGTEWEAGMSDESSDEEDGMGGGRGGGGQMDPTAVAIEEPDEIEYDPEARSVTLTLSGAIVALDIEIQENQVLLRRVRTTICSNLQDLTNRPMSPYELIKSLRRRGLEIAPSHDVSSLIEELAKNKNQIVERNLYRCLALLAASEKFSFLHSRWNQVAGDENFVLQYQTLENETMSSPSLAQIAIDRTRLLPINEGSLSLEQDGIKDTEPLFYADLFNALYESAPAEIRDQILEPSPAFVETIYAMLSATRPASLA